MHIAASAVALLATALFLCAGVAAFVYHVKSQRRVPLDIESSSLPGRATFHYYQHHDSPPALDLSFPTPMVDYGGPASLPIKVLSPVFKPAPLLPPGLGRVPETVLGSPSARFRKMDPECYNVSSKNQENTSSVIHARAIRQHSYSPIVQSPLVPTTPHRVTINAPPLNPLRLQYLPARNALPPVPMSPSNPIAASVNIPSYHLPSRNNALRTGTHSYAAWLTNVPVPLSSWQNQPKAVPDYEDDLQTRRPATLVAAEHNSALTSRQPPSVPRYLDATKTLRLPTLSPLDRLAQAAVPIYPDFDTDGFPKQDLCVNVEGPLALPSDTASTPPDPEGLSSRYSETPTFTITTPTPLTVPPFNYSLPRPQLRERPSFLYGSTSTLSLATKKSDTATSDFASNVNMCSDPSASDAPRGHADRYPKNPPMPPMQRGPSHRGAPRDPSPVVNAGALKPTTGAFSVSHRSPTLPEFNFSVNAVPLDVDIDLAPLLSPQCM